VEIRRKNERKIVIKRSGPLAAYEILAASRKTRPHWKLFKIEGKEKLFGIDPSTPGVG
jgi:hypothetical protein